MHRTLARPSARQPRQPRAQTPAIAVAPSCHTRNLCTDIETYRTAVSNNLRYNMYVMTEDLMCKTSRNLVGMQCMSVHREESIKCDYDRRNAHSCMLFA